MGGILPVPGVKNTMRIGQTSAIVFVSKLFGSAIGFLGTLYFARLLGAEVLGIFAVVTAIVAWLGLVSNLGISAAVNKRISEGRDQGEYLTTGLLMSSTLTFIIAVLTVVFQDFFDIYVDGFQDHIEISVVVFIIMFLFINLGHSLVTSTLSGQRQVHLVGLLSPVKISLISIIQIGFVFAGFGLLGMLIGHGAGLIIVTLIGATFISIRLNRPAKEHLKSIFNYAKYAWLGGLEKRSFNDVDVLVLSVFVSSSVIGVYAVAWSLAKFLVLFGRSIRKSLFPEISLTSAQGEDDVVATLVRDGLAFGGLIAIPGLVGGVILADRLLLIYGPEFVDGTTVLGLLILAVLLHGYQKLMMNALDAVDRPDISFRINAIFIAVNLVLNVILIWRFGLVGAAIATTISAGIGAIVSYVALSQIVSFEFPFVEISLQILAALFMGAVVLATLEIVVRTGLIQQNVVIVVGHVGLGACVYFLSLLVLSKEFRATVHRNLPVGVTG